MYSYTVSIFILILTFIFFFPKSHMLYYVIGIYYKITAIVGYIFSFGKINTIVKMRLKNVDNPYCPVAGRIYFFPKLNH